MTFAEIYAAIYAPQSRQQVLAAIAQLDSLTPDLRAAWREYRRNREKAEWGCRA
jgi:hypothetical protein